MSQNSLQGEFFTQFEVVKLNRMVSITEHRYKLILNHDKRTVGRSQFSRNKVATLSFSRTDHLIDRGSIEVLCNFDAQIKKIPGNLPNELDYRNSVI